MPPRGNPLGVPMGMIVYNLIAGEPDDMLDWYGRAVEEREPLAMADTLDPNTAPLESNLRWVALLRTMGVAKAGGPLLGIEIVGLHVRTTNHR